MMIHDKFIQSSPLDIEYLTRALRQGKLSGTAQTVDEYERELASTFQSAHAVAVSSGSTALQAALHVLNVGTSSEVLLPAIAPLPTIFPVTANGAIPVPVDTRRGCLDFDPDDLRAKLSERTRAAIIVPLWGYPIDLTDTLAILDEAGIPLIEDAAHAHGASWNGKPVGTSGIIGCFSTHDRKLLATGEGGFLLTGSDTLAERLRSYTQLGNLAGKTAGVNFKFNAMAAAIGLARLKDLQIQIGKRKANATKIIEKIEIGCSVSELPIPQNSAPNYYNLVLVLAGRHHDEARETLNKIHAAGIPIDQLKYGYDVFYRRYVYKSVSWHCPSAESFVNRVIQLPVHPNITERDIARMVEIIKAVGHDREPCRRQAFHRIRAD